MSDDEKGYEGWANWDTWATALVLDNTESTYKWLIAWNENFKRKIMKGKFDREQARKVVKKYLVPVARGTNKRFAWDSSFTPDPNIDISKVNADEIVDHILDINDEGDELRRMIANPPPPKPKKIKMMGLPIDYYDSSTGYPEPTPPPKPAKTNQIRCKGCGMKLSPEYMGTENKAMQMCSRCIVKGEKAINVKSHTRRV